MKRSLWLTLPLLAFATLAPSHHVQAKPGRPRLKLIPSIFDFGFMPTGVKVSTRFWLGNSGSDTLRIAEVKPMCGCTTAPLKKNLVAPGDSVPLDVVFDSKNITGVVNKKVTINSNDSTHGPTEIFFTARVQDQDTTMTVRPKGAAFPTIDKISDTIALTNDTKAECRIRLATAPPDFIKCLLSSDRMLPGASVSIILTRGKGAPVGEYETSITLWIDGPFPHAISIPIKGIGYLE
jgi:hypothetical protein